MRPRAPWLVLAGAASLTACGLSTEGASPGGAGNTHDSGDTVDAADQGNMADGSSGMPDDSGGGHPPMDASMHKPDAGPDATHPGGPDAGAGDGAPGGGDAQEFESGGDDGPGDTGTIDNDTGTQGGPCDGGTGCVSVPPGWSLVAF